jgi:arsenical pump membrane protein
VASGEWVAVAALMLMLATVLFRASAVLELTVAVTGAGAVLASGALSPAGAEQVLRGLGPVVAFLVVILVLAEACRAEGLFAALGGWLGRASNGRPQRMLAQTFLIAAVTTAVLSLDATVVLLTPVVAAAALRQRLRTRPHVFACAHLANSASLLMPISNLTNLLAFSASGLGFLAFTGLMAPVWLVGIAVEYAVFRLFFRRDLQEVAPPVGGGVPVLPKLALGVIAGVLVGFAASGPLGIPPVGVAAAGAVALAASAYHKGRLGARDLLVAANLPFASFVLALGLVVAAVVHGGVAGELNARLPVGASLPALLALALVATVAANVLNNLPATLLLVPLVAGSGSAAVLAVLIGVNAGSNASYVGSLANLLWRRSLLRIGVVPRTGDFLRLGALSTLPTVVACVAALWLAFRVGA